jgi:predicted acylesterase/phospholipase RssA
MAYKNYGRSALCLSGGATIAYYHYGVIKGLLEEDMLPRVITGASAGSMIGNININIVTRFIY